MLRLSIVWLTGCLLMITSSYGAGLSGTNLMWEKLTPIPNQKGLGSPYAGVSQGELIVAGGANFPDAPPWDGGHKLYHDDIYALSSYHATWRKVGKLVRPMGYGISVTTDEGVFCAGGSDLTNHYRDAFLLQRRADGIATTVMPPLPKAMANGSGAIVGDVVYVAGGLDTPTSTNTMHNFWALDLKNAKPEWRELKPWPGPARMLAVAASVNGAFYLAAGCNLTGDTNGKPVRTYLKDVYRFTPTEGWKRMADIPRGCVAAPSPAPTLNDSIFLALSGDDGTKIGFQPLSQHPGFAKDILAYDIKTDSWSTFGTVPVTQVTVPAVAWKGGHVLPNGEIRPGVRTAEVWNLSPIAPGSKSP